MHLTRKRKRWGIKRTLQLPRGKHAASRRLKGGKKSFCGNRDDINREPWRCSSRLVDTHLHGHVEPARLSRADQSLFLVTLPRRNAQHASLVRSWYITSVRPTSAHTFERPSGARRAPLLNAIFYRGPFCSHAIVPRSARRGGTLRWLVTRDAEHRRSMDDIESSPRIAPIQLRVLHVASRCHESLRGGSTFRYFDMKQEKYIESEVSFSLRNLSSITIKEKI